MSKPFDRDTFVDRRTCTEATAGPWSWEVNLKCKDVRLKSWPRGGYTVMGFERWGMQGGQPVFLRDGLMEPVKEFAAVIPGREHHADWARSLDHPDARFIEEARTAWPAYIDEVERLRAEVATLRAEIEQRDRAMGAIARGLREMEGCGS